MCLGSEPVNGEGFTQATQGPFKQSRDRVISGPRRNRPLNVLRLTARCGFLAFTLLTLTLDQGMSLGVAYGIWAAAGVALTALGSRVFFKESICHDAGARTHHRRRPAHRAWCRPLGRKAAVCGQDFITLQVPAALRPLAGRSSRETAYQHLRQAKLDGPSYLRGRSLLLSREGV